MYLPDDSTVYIRQKAIHQFYFQFRKHVRGISDRFPTQITSAQDDRSTEWQVHPFLLSVSPQYIHTTNQPTTSATQRAVKKSVNFQPNVTTLRSVTGIAIPSVVCLFVCRLCDVGALYSQGLIFAPYSPYCSLAIWLGCEKKHKSIYNCFPQGLLR